MPTNGWIGVDFDGTLVTHKFPGTGEPIWPMVNRVKDWLAKGQEVRIFTARVSVIDYDEVRKQYEIVQNWCQKYLGQRLDVTCSKTIDCIAIYDDRAVQVETNTGRIIKNCEKCHWTHVVVNHDDISKYNY